MKIVLYVNNKQPLSFKKEMNGNRVIAIMRQVPQGGTVQGAAASNVVHFLKIVFSNWKN